MKDWLNALIRLNYWAKQLIHEDLYFIIMKKIAENCLLNDFSLSIIVTCIRKCTSFRDIKIHLKKKCMLKRNKSANAK